MQYYLVLKADAGSVPCSTTKHLSNGFNVWQKTPLGLALRGFLLVHQVRRSL